MSTLTTTKADLDAATARTRAVQADPHATRAERDAAAEAEEQAYAAASPEALAAADAESAAEFGWAGRGFTIPYSKTAADLEGPDPEWYNELAAG